MQEIQETEPRVLGRSSRVSNQGFPVLLALARKSLTKGELNRALGMNASESALLLGRLERSRLIQVGSETDEDRDGQPLSLTCEGERVLLHEMEQMCELPER